MIHSSTVVLHDGMEVSIQLKAVVPGDVVVTAGHHITVISETVFPKDCLFYQCVAVK